MGMVYTYLIGKFLQQLIAGNSYVLVVYEYDANCIKAIPTPNRTGPVIVSSYKKARQLLDSCGFKTLLQYLDNEAYHALQSFMAEPDIDFQLDHPMSTKAMPSREPSGWSRIAGLIIP
jgi:hypothetical protein